MTACFSSGLVPQWLAVDDRRADQGTFEPPLERVLPERGTVALGQACGQAASTPLQAFQRPVKQTQKKTPLKRR